MRIAIDALATDCGLSGLSTYAKEVVRWLPRLGRDHEFEVVHHADDGWVIEGASGVHSLPISPRWRHPAVNMLWHQLELPRLAHARGWDAVLLAAGNRRLPVWMPCASVATIHDLASCHHPERFGALRGSYVRRVVTRLVGRLDHAIAISQDARRDVLAFSPIRPDRVTVVPQAADTDRFIPGDREAARRSVAEKFGILDPYILYVSRVEHPSKNHVRLIDALAEAHRTSGVTHRLVCVGADRERAGEVHAHRAGSPIAGRIDFLGFVDDAALLDLYRAADALVFPSLFEGFGLPVLEAMATGLPVACARAASLPEVGGDAAIYFDPYDVSDMARAIAAVLADPAGRGARADRSRARALEFSWEATAARTLAVLEAAVERRRAPG